MASDLTYEQAHELFYYDENTGILYNKITRNPKAKASTPVGTFSGGYLRVQVDKKSFRLARIIYIMYHNIIPIVVDHIDGDPLNNRIFNLRNVSPRENSQNIKAIREGIKLLGVRKDSRNKNIYYTSTIKVRNTKGILVQKYLGIFRTEVEAHNRYMEEFDKIKELSYL